MLKALSIVGYVGMIGGFVGLLVMRELFSFSPLVVLLQATAILLFLWARATFGRRSYHVAANPTEGGVVRSGPYRYVRHPIYTAFCLFAWAGVATYWSWKTALFGGLILVSAIVRVFCEEVLVAARYPEYRQYAATNWRMLPFVF